MQMYPADESAMRSVRSTKAIGDCQFTDAARMYGELSNEFMRTFNAQIGWPSYAARTSKW